jgi:hypothetical protein
MEMESTFIACLTKVRSNIADTYEMDSEILESIFQIILRGCEPLKNLSCSCELKKQEDTEATAAAKKKSVVYDI